MPPIVTDILNILADLLRMVGMGVFGFAAAMFALEVFRKGQQVWMLQVAVFLGILGVAIAFAVFVSAAGLGAFGIGAGVGLVMGLRPAAAKPADEAAAKKK